MQPLLKGINKILWRNKMSLQTQMKKIELDIVKTNINQRYFENEYHLLQLKELSNRNRSQNLKSFWRVYKEKKETEPIEVSIENYKTDMKGLSDLYFKTEMDYYESLFDDLLEETARQIKNIKNPTVD